MDVKFGQAAAAYASTGQMKGSLATPKMPGEESSNGFGDLLAGALDQARQTGYRSESLSSSAVAGKAQMHELVTAVTNADLELQTIVAVRDKMISAYTDILKMPI